MVFPYKVKYNGEFFAPGTEIPEGKKMPEKTEVVIETEQPKKTTKRSK